MKSRSIVSLLFLASVTGPAIGAPPTDSAQRPHTGRAHAGRVRLEAQLQRPASLDLGQKKTVAAKEIISRLREQQGLSIRADLPALFAAFGDAGVERNDDEAANNPANALHPKSFVTTPPLPVSPYFNQEIEDANQENEDANRSRVAALPPPPSPSATVGAPLPSETGAPESAGPQPVLLPAPKAEPGPGSKPKALEKPSIPLTSSNCLDVLLSVEVNVETIDLTRVSVATVLRHALDAVVANGRSVESDGLPIPTTYASVLDYVIEDDGVLITTRMKALTHKETRVYSIRNLKAIPQDELVATIRQSIRPWSWRSQINDLGEKLKGTPLPIKSLGSLVRSGMWLVEPELAEMVTLGGVVEKVAFSSKSSEPPVEPRAGQNSDLEEAALVGNALVNGLVTFAHATLSAVEMYHYGEPPTGTILALPGRLVVTQSQAAHREIAELLEELADE